MKKVLLGAEARSALKSGVDLCADVVSPTLGKRGKNVGIYNGTIIDIINDGVSIVSSIDVEDEATQAGVMLARQCAARTDRIAGDGTTTTIVLLRLLLDEIVSDFSTSDSRTVRAQLEEDVKNTLKQCDVTLITQKNADEIRNIAKTSCLDDSLADKIADKYVRFGCGVHFIVKESSHVGITVEEQSGLQFDSKIPKGASIVIDEETIEDVDVMVFEESLSSPNMLQERIKEGMEKVVVIAPSIDPNIVISMMASDINFYPVEFRGLSDMDDVMAYDGDKLGQVILGKSSSTLIGTKRDYVKKLEKKLQKEEGSFEKEKLEKRIAALSSAVVTLHVGKETPVETHEYALKAEDAINAVRGAMEEGYVIGGGRGLQKAANGKILKSVCDKFVEKIGDIDESVIDSYRTVRCALTHAASTAAAVLTTESLLLEQRDDD